MHEAVMGSLFCSLVVLSLAGCVTSAQLPEPSATAAKPRGTRKNIHADPVAAYDDAAREGFHGEIGLHGYAIASKWLFGAQIGMGHGRFGFDFDMGLLWNDERLERFDAVWLGWDMGGGLHVDFFRSGRWEGRIGPGFRFLTASQVDDSLDYWALTTPISINFSVLKGTRAQLQFEPVWLATDGLSVGPVPLLIRFALLGHGRSQ